MSELQKLIQSVKNQSNDNKTVTLGIINEQVAKQILLDSNIDVRNYVITIDIYAVKHIFKNHSNAEKEEKRGQFAIQESDFEMIEQVINNPDFVFYDGKNRIGRDVLQFQKQINNRYIILKEVRTGKKQLSLNSMRIIKNKKS